MTEQVPPDHRADAPGAPDAPDAPPTGDAEDARDTTDSTAAFEAERRRLTRIAAQVLGDRTEAEDVVQQAWLRLHGTTATIDNLPAWLTTVTTRLCLDRLRARTPDLDPDLGTDRGDGADVGAHPGGRLDAAGGSGAPSDPAEDIALADTVGVALQVVLDRLSPRERVAFVLHDSFGFEFPTIAAVLDTTPVAARKLASRARAKVAQPAAEDALADWAVVDAFMAAARGGDFARLVELLAPGAVVIGDAAAIAIGTPERMAGRDEIATFFNGAAHAALPVFVGDRPGSAWFDRGVARVVFDFTLVAGRVARIDFRATPAVLEQVARRRDGERR